LRAPRGGANGGANKQAHRTMKLNTTSTLTSLALLLALALPAAAPAQTSAGAFARHAGEREFTHGGAGASDREFSDSFGGVSFSYGYFTSETQEVALRQSINYSNPDPGGRAYNGSTRLAFDQHFATSSALRPFLGVNAGGIYGDSVRDSFAAGLEGGLKYYVQPRTFVYGMIDWGWTFRHARNLSDRFSSGQYNWSLGVGFNF
jgi:hypothetical protein